MILLVGLGNPGREYALTRHNLGFLLVDLLAERWGLSFKEERRGELARGVFRGEKVLLFKPKTYMNLSGEAVRMVIDYYKPEELLVVADDVHLPFGRLRLLEKGGAGGHNGLKSIEQHVGGQEYKRLRMGVGGSERADLSDHVLGKFSAQEKEQLAAFLMEGAEAIERWLEGDFSAAMKQANTRKD